MRVSRTPLALAALLFVTACGGSAELLAPDGTSASTATNEERGGLGMMGSGNAVAADTTFAVDGVGQFGSGN